MRFDNDVVMQVRTLAAPLAKSQVQVEELPSSQHKHTPSDLSANRLPVMPQPSQPSQATTPLCSRGHPAQAGELAPSAASASVAGLASLIAHSPAGTETASPDDSAIQPAPSSAVVLTADHRININLEVQEVDQLANTCSNLLPQQLNSSLQQGVATATAASVDVVIPMQHQLVNGAGVSTVCSCCCGTIKPACRIPVPMLRDTVIVAWCTSNA